MVRWGCSSTRILLLQRIYNSSYKIQLQALTGWPYRLYWPCPSQGKTMELLLAAIIGFSIGYLLGPLFYDH